MSTIVADVTTGQVLGVVDGRDSAGVGAWLAARPTGWLAQVEVVAIDPSAAFRKALRTHLPCAAVSVDPFHLVKLGNDTLTAVRQRLSRDHKGRRGRLVDPAWANRKLLLRGADTFSERGWDRLGQVLRTDDPTDELGATWGIKEQLRRLLKTTTLADAHEAKMLLGHYVMVADMPETDRLWNTICAWWAEIEVLIITGARERADRGREHLDQEHQTHRSRLSELRQLPGPYPPEQRSPQGRVNTQISTAPRSTATSRVGVRRAGTRTSVNTMPM